MDPRNDRQTEHWADEVKTFHGLTTDGLNLFLMGGLQFGTPNFTELYNEQSRIAIVGVVEEPRRSSKPPARPSRTGSGS